MAANQIMPEDIAQADDMDWTEENEFWNTYRLSDGTLLKVKMVLKGVKRLKKYSPDGTPIYIIMSDNVVRAMEIQGNVKLKPKPSNMKPT
jgi:hypothetical protein